MAKPTRINETAKKYKNKIEIQYNKIYKFIKNIFIKIENI